MDTSLDQTLDKTSLATIDLLESRLHRIEHLLYGASAPPAQPSNTSAADSLAELEHRFTSLLSRLKAYAELLKIYQKHPSFFQTPSPSEPPSQLSPEALRATVLACASSYPSAASALTAVINDTPIPDPALSASLAALIPRMAGIEATQLAQEAEIAELRARSEELVRGWYQGRMLGYSQSVADVEGRFEKVEQAVRRAEKAREAEAA
ncbi:uncharacterized protein E0L32_007922 [Thyridium curvatum]|uniref:Nuclear distribution protein n=1 Tax=Thyridium curvatum TaxID=1093900 RepID=A0A507B1W9_9PEZI|nr:uncharacterized protein E0L32_007922 [Thyridium curvatum]TPX11061.1 hypothetical protein E0L32_007922 [Thyridium curvatum]